MKLGLLALVFCVQSFAWQGYFEVDASATNIPAAFTTGAASRVFTLLVEPQVLTVCNSTGSRICLNNQTYDSSTPSARTHSVLAGQCFSTGARYAPTVFIDGCGTLIAAGTVLGWAD